MAQFLLNPTEDAAQSETARTFNSPDSRWDLAPVPIDNVNSGCPLFVFLEPSFSISQGNSVPLMFRPFYIQNPGSAFASDSFSIGESIYRRGHSRGFGQPQAPSSGEVSEFVAEVVTEIDMPPMEFLHVRGGRPTMAYSSHVHDDIEVEPWYDNLLQLPRPYAVFVGEFPRQHGVISFIRTGLLMSAHVPVAIRLISVLWR